MHDLSLNREKKSFCENNNGEIERKGTKRNESKKHQTETVEIKLNFEVNLNI